MKQVAVDTNRKFAVNGLGIPQFRCYHLCKTVGHCVATRRRCKRHSRPAQRHYIRTVRGDNKDPLTQFLKEQGVYTTRV